MMANSNTTKTITWGRTTILYSQGAGCSGSILHYAEEYSVVSTFQLYSQLGSKMEKKNTARRAPNIDNIFNILMESRIGQQYLDRIVLRLLPFLRYSGSIPLYAVAGSSVINTTTQRRKQRETANGIDKESDTCGKEDTEPEKCILEVKSQKQSNPVLIAIWKSGGVKMGGTDWRELALVHNAENDAWDATRNTEEQAATDHIADESLRQGESEGVFHCNGQTDCGMKRISRMERNAVN